MKTTSTLEQITSTLRAFVDAPPETRNGIYCPQAFAQARKHLGLTQSGLARALGFETALTVRRFEMDRKHKSIRTPEARHTILLLGYVSGQPIAQNEPTFTGPQTRAAREALGLTQGQLAALTATPQEVISRIEHETRPAPAGFNRLLDLLRNGYALECAA